jgi:hypothetical protein
VGDTSKITESSTLSNIGTAANATQHDINVAVNSVIPVISKIDLGIVTINNGVPLFVNFSNYGINTHDKPWLAFIYNRSHFARAISLLGDGDNSLLIYNNNAEDYTGMIKLAILHSPT